MGEIEKEPRTFLVRSRAASFAFAVPASLIALPMLD